MKFQVKIVLVTLVILIFALVLSSILSLASFEKIYVNSLVSTYEIAGKNLKRKIEPSLRFGKQLKNFRGMDKLLKEVLTNTPELSDVSIVNPEGKILHDLHAKNKGKNLDYFPDKLIDDTNKQKVVSELVDQRYRTFIPILKRNKERVGFIYLSFSSSIIYNKLKEIALKNLSFLWILMIVSSILLVFVMSFLIGRPIRREILSISHMLTWPPGMLTKVLKKKELNQEELLYWHSNISEYDISRFSSLTAKSYLNIQESKDEVEYLKWYVYQLVNHSLTVLQQIRHIEEQHQRLNTTQDALCEIETDIEQLLKSDALSSEELKTLQGLQQTSQNARYELSHLIALSSFIPTQEH